VKVKRIAIVGFLVSALCWVALLAAQGLPAASPESVGMSAQRLSHISVAFKQEVDMTRAIVGTAG
jgi:hypothetical protein